MKPRLIGRENSILRKPMSLKYETTKYDITEERKTIIKYRLST
jgi:hypothetical protein